MKLLRAHVRAKKGFVIVPRDETDFLAVGFIRNLQT
jgi:hypothetical protein